MYVKVFLRLKAFDNYYQLLRHRLVKTYYYSDNQFQFKEKTIMKTVYNLVKSESAIIKKLHATGDLKSRLLSLGFHKGAEISINECTPSKQTIQVTVEKMKLAIRMNEAKEIEIYE